MIKEYDIEGACVSKSPKGFMNYTLLLKWIELFANPVPDLVAHPRVLVCDMYSSHHNYGVVVKYIGLRITLFLLPDNYIHLI